MMIDYLISKLQIIYKMQSFVNIFFRSFLKELSRAKPKAYFNKPKIIQSSVGLIFRLKSKSQLNTLQEIENGQYEQVQLLFTQRAGYEGDRNAYNVVFPGGQCDNGESDIVACKRELFEQIGLKVDEQCIYLGQLPKNFYYLQKRQKYMYLTCHVWCLAKDHNQWKQKLNADELRDSKWVNLADMLNDNNYLIENSLRLGILERMASRYKLKIIADVSKNIISISTPELNLGMARNLWGLTLWVWCYVLQMACRSLDMKNIEQNKVKDAKKWIKDMSALEVKFKPGYLLKYPSLVVIKGWHYFNRIRPFTYKRREPINMMTIGLTILFIIVFILLYI